MPETAPAADDRLARFTLDVASPDLRHMTLDKSGLPGEVAAFEPLRDEQVDNDAYAKRGESLESLESLAAAKRLDGYETAFVVPQGASTLAEEPAELLEVATAVHLFESPDDVEAWIDNAFVNRLRGGVGESDALDRKIAGVELLRPAGFYGRAAGLLVLREVPGGEIASTVVEFQLGRVLGVASAVSKADKSHFDLAVDLGSRLERQIVRVVLDA